jgi:hypothetical protein
MEKRPVLPIDRLKRLMTNADRFDRLMRAEGYGARLRRTPPRADVPRRPHARGQ